MKKIMLVMLLALTVHLNDGTKTVYENAEVMKSDKYEDRLRQAWIVTKDRGTYSNYQPEAGIAGFEVQDSQQYWTVYDKDTNVALGIYPVADVAKIEA